MRQCFMSLSRGVWVRSGAHAPRVLVVDLFEPNVPTICGNVRPGQKCNGPTGRTTAPNRP